MDKAFVTKFSFPYPKAIKRIKYNARVYTRIRKAEKQPKLRHPVGESQLPGVTYTGESARDVYLV